MLKLTRGKWSIELDGQACELSRGGFLVAGFEAAELHQVAELINAVLASMEQAGAPVPGEVRR